jgi:hypothetical protein
MVFFYFEASSACNYIRLSGVVTQELTLPAHEAFLIAIVLYLESELKEAK